MSTGLGEIKRYRICVEDEHGEAHELGEFTGTHTDTVRQAELLADTWECESGHVAESLILESLGRVTDGQKRYEDGLIGNYRIE